MAVEACPKCNSDQVSSEPTAKGTRMKCSACNHSWHYDKPPARAAFAKPSPDQLRHRFASADKPGDPQNQIRAAIAEAAMICVDLTPCSPEQTRALNALDEALFLFNAAIARNE